MSSSLGPNRLPLALAAIITIPIIFVAIVINPSLMPSLSFIPLPMFRNYYTTPVVTNLHTGVSYRGTARNGVEHFQNIFYGEDTAGSNRFAPPVPVTPSRGSVLNATAAGAWCHQGTGGPPHARPICQNCLSVRIERPSRIHASAKLPVLVWIHGGLETQGSAEQN